MEEDQINNLEETDQSTESDNLVDDQEDKDLPLHKTKRFQELHNEVKELKSLAEQQREANEQLQQAVGRLASARTEPERDAIVENLLKELDEKANELTPSQLYQELEKVRKAEATVEQQQSEVVEQQTAQEILQNFNEVQSLEGLSDDEVTEFGEWMNEQLDKRGDPKIYADPHRAFHHWDKYRKVEQEARKSSEDIKSRSGTGSSSPSSGEKVKISLPELLRMSPLDAKRRSTRG